MKPATNARRRHGRRWCRGRPAARRGRRASPRSGLLIESASSWSCVTKMNVIPTCDCSSLSSICISSRSLRSSAAERLVQQQEAAAGSPGRARARRAAAARPTSRAACGWPAGVIFTISSASPTRRPISPLSTLFCRRPYATFSDDGHVREQRVVLEDRVHVALVRRHALHRVAGDADLALVGLLEPREHAERRGLAASGRARGARGTRRAGPRCRARRRP